MRQLLVSALALSLLASPVFAQSLREGSTAGAQPLQDSARAEVIKFAAAQAAGGDYMPGGMKPGYFWTSIGLLAAGGGYLLIGALAGSECAAFDIDCGGVGTRVALVGAGIAGTGVLVWIIGKNKARAAGNPQILWTPRGVAVRGGISF